MNNTKLTPYFFILPAAVIIIVFHIVPIGMALVLSFFEWDMLGSPHFVSFENYQLLFSDAEFWNSMLNTLYYVIGTVPLSILVSLFFAILLNRELMGRGFYRTVYFLPVITSLNAVALVWTWIYHPKFGLLNGFLSFFGFAPQGWLLEPEGIGNLLLQPFGVTLPDYLAGPSLALTAIIVLSIWKGLGYNIVILLATLGTIPRNLYEAGKIDGAGHWVLFRHITLPHLIPTIFFLLITSTITSFQVFNQIYMMTDPPGGPLGTTNVVVYYLYKKGFIDFEMGYASAIALVLFLIIFSITLIQYRTGGLQKTTL